MLKTFFIGATAFAAISAAANAAVHQVNEFLPGPPTSNGVWYATTAAGGTASVVSLTGAGGNLENNQTVPTGAAKLTTAYDDASRADALITGNFGSAVEFLNRATVAYDYYKEAVANPASNAFAAPALRLLVDATGGVFGGTSPTREWGYLIYEPYWNEVSGLPTIGDWETENVNPNSGVWWWSGGFGVANGTGGPPLHTLAEWAGIFGGTAFDNAIIAGIGVGVGSYNQGQIGYFDNVTFALGNTGETWDFEADGVVPEPMTFAVWSVLGLCGSAFAWRTKRSQLTA